MAILCYDWRRSSSANFDFKMTMKCILMNTAYVYDGAHELYIYMRRPRGASGWTLASHRWGLEFASRSLHVGFVVDETGSG